MESRVEKMEKSLLELRKENHIRLDEIKRLWKRRKGDYSRRQTRRDHAPSRRCRNTTRYTEEDKNEEIGVDLKLQNSESCNELGNQVLLLEAMDSNLPKSEAREEEKKEEGEGVSEAVVETEIDVHFDRSSVLSQSTEFAAKRMGEVARGGCCPSMDLFRSELVQLIIPMESAHRTVSYLGDLGLLQFKDFNAEKSPFQRFSDDSDQAKVTTAAAPKPNPHHRGVAPLLLDQTIATTQLDQHHHDAIVRPRSDLEPPPSLRAKTMEASVGNLYVPPPEPPDPPDQGALVGEVGITHGLLVFLFLAAEECDRDGREKAGRGAGTLGRVGRTLDRIGQAQTYPTNCVQINNERGVFQAEKEIEEVVVGNKRADKSVKTHLSKQRQIIQAQFLAIGQQAKQYGEAQGSPTHFIILEEAKSNFSYPLFSAPETGALKLCNAVSLLPPPKPPDLGAYTEGNGSSSVTRIAWSSCFKLWDPGESCFQLLQDDCPIQQLEVLAVRQVVQRNVEVQVKWNQLPTCENSWESWDELQEAFPESHLGDKVSFEGGGIDENPMVNPNPNVGARPNRFNKVYVRRHMRGKTHDESMGEGNIVTNTAELAERESPTLE